jgi:long-chain fatty acid transport protein
MISKVACRLFCLITLVISYADAGGLILYELGTQDLGLASAGWAARADDAGTAFTNPAGMTRLKNKQFLFGAQPIYIHIKFDPNSETTVKGTDGDSSTWFPAGGAYIVAPITDRLSVGAAATGYFGAALDYGHHWVGRYYLVRSLCQGYSFIPGAAYKLTDNLSIGLSANIMYSVFRTHEQINNALDKLPDGRLRLTGDNWAVGAIVGVLYEFDECTRFGVQYVSEVKQTFNMKPTFLDIGPKLDEILRTTGVLNSRVKIFCNVPNWVMVSAYRKITPSLALMGNVGWQQWSNFGRAEISLNNENATTLSTSPKYDDTWHGALGLEYFIDDFSKCTLGIAYDSSMVSNKNRSVSLPVGQQWRFGTGYQYAYTENVKFCFVYELMWSGDLKVFQDRGPLAGTVAGKFTNTCNNFFNLSVIWDF